MKKHQIELLLLLLTILLMMPGCEEGENMEFTDSPIIEAFLTPGTCFNVKISRQVPFSADVEYSSDDIDNLDVVVSYEDAVYQLESYGDGIYVDSSLMVVESAGYTISFVFNSKNVSAYTYIPAKPVNFKQSATSISIERTDSTDIQPFGSMPDPISFTWDNDDLSYYLAVVENIEDTLDPIRDFGDDDLPDNIFKKTPTTSTSEELRPMDFEYYGTHRVILYHVLPDYATLYEENSNSSQNLTNPSTSIINGYGIFTGLNSDTLFVEVCKAK